MRYILAVLLLSCGAFAQQGTAPTITPYSTDPTGKACSPAQMAVYNGGAYVCKNGTFILSSGGGGGAGLTGSGTANTITKFTGTSAVGNSSATDDGTNPTQLPNGASSILNGFYDQLANANPGTVLNKTVCRDASNQGIVCPTNVTGGVHGVAGSGAGNSGNVQVCWSQCTVLFDNQTTIGDYAIPSVTTAGELHDSGTTETAGVQNFIVDSVNSGAGTTAMADILTPDQIAGGGNGGGNIKGTTLQINGTISHPIGNVNNTTPAAPGGNTNVTWQVSNSGNTTSISAYVTAPLLVNGIIDGTAPITITTGSSATIGAGTYKSGYTYNQNATAATAITYTLPTAAAGLQYCVANSYNGSAADTGVLTVASSASGQFIIFSDGTLSASGGNVTSGGAGGDAACFVGVDSTHWQFYSQVGTWTKH